GACSGTACATSTRSRAAWRTAMHARPRWRKQHERGRREGRAAMNTARKVGLVGARGHVGAELIRLLAAHPGFELRFVSSRELDGRRVGEQVPEYGGALRYRNIAHEALGEEPVDAYVLALPNGKAPACVANIEAGNPDAVIVDVSADYRFDPGWYYGLPELNRGAYAGQ